MQSNTFLYKYQDWNYKWHRKSLMNNQVYFSNNFKLNDPFDLNLPFRPIGFLPMAEPLWIKAFVDKEGKFPNETDIEDLKKNTPQKTPPVESHKSRKTFKVLLILWKKNMVFFAYPKLIKAL